MLAIEVRLLTGRYSASNFEDRAATEWPPHPARLYYAAVDAALRDSDDEDAITVLRWWESQGAPEMSCSAYRDDGTPAWTERSAVTHYVAGNFATSWARDVHPQWREIASLELIPDENETEKQRLAREKKHDKLVSKLKADTIKYTASEKSAPDAALELLPENRNHQPRYFPVVHPDSDTIVYTWPTAEPSDSERAELDRIVGSIARLGHSSSMVSCRLIPSSETPAPTWVPAADDSTRITSGSALRTVQSGVLDILMTDFRRHQGISGRALPALMTTYSAPGSEPINHAQGIVHDQSEWIVFPLDPRESLSLARTYELTRAVRGALMSHGPQPVPPFISGHRQGGAPSAALDASHLSVLALPNVGHMRSDGLIRAVALALPESTTDDEKHALHSAINAWRDDSRDQPFFVTLPGGTERFLSNPVVHSPTTGFDKRAGVSSRSYWARPATHWASVTPVALDRHPKVKPNAGIDEINDAISAIVERTCRLVGLPTPLSVSAVPGSPWPNVPPVQIGRVRNPEARRRFPQYGAGTTGHRNYTTHLQITFDEPVSGPLILGAGRYFGYGLLLPMPGSRRDQ